MVPKGADAKGERLLRGDYSQIMISQDSSEQKSLPYPILINQNQAKAESALPNEEFPQITLQSRSTQTGKVKNREEKTWKEAISVLQNSHEKLPQSMPKISLEDMSNTPALTAAERKQTIHNQDSQDELEEEEFHQLLLRLMDAFTLEMPSGMFFKINRDNNG